MQLPPRRATDGHLLALLALLLATSGGRVLAARGSNRAVQRSALLGRSADGAADVAGDLGLLAASGGALAQGEPATLEQYCKSKDGAVAKGVRVEADWMGYGMKYPGKIKEVNKDGTVDIAYDDGFDEMKVDMKHVKTIKEGPDKDPKDDPACQLQGFVKKVKRKVDEVRKDVHDWIASKAVPKLPAGTVPNLPAGTGGTGGGAGAGGSATGATGQGTGAGEGASGRGGGEEEWDEAEEAQAAANATEDQSEELERLKERLSAKDSEIQKLEEELQETDEQLRGGKKGAGASSGPKTVDDLIAKYRARLKRREKRIEELKARLAKKKQQLEEKTTDPKPSGAPSLADIQSKLQDLAEDVDGARKKRRKLEEEGELDPELAHSLDGIFQQQDLLEGQFDELQGIEEERKKGEEAVRRAVAEAGQAVGAAGDRAAEVQKEASRRVNILGDNLIKKAKDVEKDLQGVQKGVENLNTGVHPHGEKWWRYRYEHAYVDALLMVLIATLMLIWERLYQWIRAAVYHRSSAKDIDRISHGTMFTSWLEFCSGELMTCLFVFLSCWVLAQCNAFEAFPLFLKESRQLHLPTNGLEYRRLALDLCVTLCLSVILYYILTLSVVYMTTETLHSWASLEDFIRTESVSPLAFRIGPSLGIHTGPTDEARESYHKLKTYFLRTVQSEPALLAAIQREGESSFNPATFPFWVYMRLAVRIKVDKLFQFGAFVWITLVMTFIVLAFFHRFTHVGSVRVMAATVLVLVVLLVFMALWINSVARSSTEHAEAQAVMDKQGAAGGAGGLAEEESDDCCGSIHRQFSTEEGIIFILHYLLFLMCYFAACFICQPWMWRLHFEMVLTLTLVLVALSAMFVVLVAPMIPDFCVALAMPPYVDPTDVKTMMEAVAINQTLTQESMEQALVRPRRTSVDSREIVGQTFSSDSGVRT